MKHWVMGMVVIGLATGSALGAHGYRGYGTRGGYRQTTPAYGPGSFFYEAERIKARHSRDRYQTHPRSYYNSPQRGMKHYAGRHGYYGGPDLVD